VSTDDRPRCPSCNRLTRVEDLSDEGRMTTIDGWRLAVLVIALVALVGRGVIGFCQDMLR
jgi:hypothetical protein